VPIGYVWNGKTGDGLVLHVEQGSNPNLEFFGWVEVWWKRSISPAPPAASFDDVPTTHPFFQYIEALKASGITGGCSSSPPLFCPDSPLTRGQMAVFVSKALGLQWSGAVSDDVTYNVTTVPATRFYPFIWYDEYYTSGDLGRFGGAGVITDFYSALDLPGGAAIDFIGLNSNTNTDGAYGVELLRRHADGSLSSIVTFQSTAHGWDTDFNPMSTGYTWNGQSGDALILHVQEAALANPQYFGSVEVWWRPSVSPAPPTPSFNDVPTSHPFFQYIEALKASGVTGGCQANPPLFCPNNTLTRGQMAVFLAKALGLHWPGN
jgi:hypothetical protein